MTRYQTLICWNKIWMEAGSQAFTDRRLLIEYARRVNSKWSANAQLYYLEWEDEHPEEQILVRRFTSRELSWGGRMTNQPTTWPDAIVLTTLIVSMFTLLYLGLRLILKENRDCCEHCHIHNNDKEEEE